MSNFEKKLSILVLLISLGHSIVLAQHKTVKLWENTIPNAKTYEGFQEIKIYKDSIFYSTSKVTEPTLTIFTPIKETLNGTAVIICPGGGYSHLAIDKEGFKVAKWFNSIGITAFVLKYRLPNNLIMDNKAIGPLQDAQEAIRYVRRNAAKWNLDKNKIGIMGFSAGGHLASTVSTQYNSAIYTVADTVSAKPNFSILIYPVISMNAKITHLGSKTNLLGEHPDNFNVKKFSNELQVNNHTPKTFLIHATDDQVVDVENSINYYLSLKNNNVPVELHLFERGGHGFGLGTAETNNFWPNLLMHWLKNNKL